MSGIVIAVFNLVRCALLFCGVHYERPLLILPYIVVEANSVVAVTLLLVLGTIALSVAVGFHAGFLFFLFFGLLAVLTAYFLYVVVSHYKDLDERLKATRGVDVSNVMATRH